MNRSGWCRLRIVERVAASDRDLTADESGGLSATSGLVEPSAATGELILWKTATLREPDCPPAGWIEAPPGCRGRES